MILFESRDIFSHSCNWFLFFACVVLRVLIDCGRIIQLWLQRERHYLTANDNTSARALYALVHFFKPSSAKQQREGHCVVLLSKALKSHIASLHPGV